MNNTIEACKRASTKLVFFDNVYMYGKVRGPMTEETPFNPCSKKGEIRAKIATTLINEWKSGTLTGLIARAADFYGTRYAQRRAECSGLRSFCSQAESLMARE